MSARRYSLYCIKRCSLALPVFLYKTKNTGTEKVLTHLNCRNLLIGMPHSDSRRCVECSRPCMGLWLCWPKMTCYEKLMTCVFRKWHDITYRTTFNWSVSKNHCITSVPHVLYTCTCPNWNAGQLYSKIPESSIQYFWMKKEKKTWRIDLIFTNIRWAA